MRRNIIPERGVVMVTSPVLEFYNREISGYISSANARDFKFCTSVDHVKYSNNILFIDRLFPQVGMVGDT